MEIIPPVLMKDKRFRLKGNADCKRGDIRKIVLLDRNHVAI